MKHVVSLPLLCAIALCLSAPILPAQSTIFLVRHAEKAQNGDTKDPDLSEAGRSRADALARMLKDAEITAVYATDYKRTQQTAAPVAEAAKVQVAAVNADDATTLVTKLKEERGNSLVVGHSNTLPQIIKALGISESVTINDDDYDNLFVVIPGEKPRLLRLHYR